jgi:hypothetical protein
MKHYRLLNIGEIVEDGDEEYSSDELMDDVDCPCPEWRPVSVTFIGEAVQEAIDPPVRREDQGTDTVPTKYHDDLMQSALNVRVKLEAKLAAMTKAMQDEAAGRVVDKVLAEDELAAMTAERSTLKRHLDEANEIILKRMAERDAMTAAKNKALEMLRCTDDGPRTRECYNAVTGRDFDKDIAELEKVK